MRKLFLAALCGCVLGATTVGIAVANGTTRFSDVPAGHFAYDAVAWAVDNGITTGVGNNRFDPDGQLTRAQAVTFLYRALVDPGTGTGHDHPHTHDTTTTSTTTTTTPPPPTVPEHGFTDVSAGWRHSCAIRIDKTLTCWGHNDNGQTDAPTGEFWEVAAGHEHSCAIRSNNTITCWGQIVDAPTGEFWDIAAGHEHSCAIRTDSLAIECWGYNDNGQTDAPTGEFWQVAAGNGHSCAIRSNNTITCWGHNGEGQTDAPTGEFGTVTVDEFGTVTIDARQHVSASNGHSCAIRSDNTLTCWGYNRYYQTNAPTGEFWEVAAGHEHSCAIRSDNTLTCWGQIVDAPTGEFWQVAAGSSYSCAIRIGSLAIECWGKNDSGQTDAPS